MKASIAKALYWDLGYSVRQTAIISELSEDYVRKLIHEQRSVSKEPDLSSMTEGMKRRQKTIDTIMSLRGAYFVENDQKFCYISLLSYMGFTREEIGAIFPLDNTTFLGVATYRSSGAWKRFDSTIIGVLQSDYSYTFLEHDLTWKPQTEEAVEEATQEVLDRREQRRLAKMKNRAKNC